MSARDDLQAVVQNQGAEFITVRRLDLAELLAELDAARTGGVDKPVSKYLPEFDETWALYPARPGASKAATFKAWTARRKAGVSVIAMIDGTRAYAEYCRAERTEPQFIKQPATFFGPGEHFASDWKPKKSARAPVLSVQEQNARNSAEARRLLGFRDLDAQGSIL